jgi:hypothetical protein
MIQECTPKCTSHLLLICVKPFSLRQKNNTSKEKLLIISHGTVHHLCFVVYKLLIMILIYFYQLAD